MSIKDTVKGIIPISIKARIKLGKDLGYYKKIVRDLAGMKDYDILVGTPIHTNLGDHLIAASAIRMIEENSGKKLVEIPTEVFLIYRKKLEETVRKDAVVYVNGGGWMGNLWPFEESVMQNIFLSFKNNRIIVLPQTVFYDKSKPLYDELLKSSKAAIKECRNLTLYLRDEQSYSFCKNNIGLSNIKLVPDMALAYKYEANDTADDDTNKTIGVCFRDDREVVESGLKANIASILQMDGFVIRHTSTMADYFVSPRKRDEELKRKMDEFRKYKLVLTDRLHGMLFSYITGTPCIIFDNKTRKVSGIYSKWLHNSEYILPCVESMGACDIDEFAEKAEKFTPSDFSEEFTELKEDIYRGNH